MEENTRENQGRLDNLNEFLTKTMEYDRNAAEGSLVEFLGEISLITDWDQAQDQEARDVVWVMTMHMAKGLEFDQVFVIGMEEGIFPHSRSMLKAGELEEERRLCYVAFTRARKRLYLTHTQRRNLYGQTSANPPSRFLGEFDNPAFSERPQPSFVPGGGAVSGNRTGAMNRPGAANGIGTLNRAGAMNVAGTAKGTGTASETGALTVGDKVRHTKWGDGVVVSVRGKGTEAEYQIAFPELGIKKLLAQYAPIKKV
jgi:DNA helicase-2/ATP-dependent DNA helicase PcrA